MLAEKLDVNTVICSTGDLIADSGVCAVINDEQVALFWLPDEERPLYAIQNYDPIGNANVLSRGIIGDLGGEPVVASPLYKQHFRLSDGVCLEQPDVKLRVFPAEIRGDKVVLLG